VQQAAELPVRTFFDTRSSHTAGKWTVQQAAELSVAAPTIEAALDGRFLSGLKEQRVAAAKYYESLGLAPPKKLEVPRNHCPVLSG